MHTHCISFLPQRWQGRHIGQLLPFSISAAEYPQLGQTSLTVVGAGFCGARLFLRCARCAIIVSLP
jgi:hypothetical protein